MKRSHLLLGLISILGILLVACYFLVYIVRFLPQPLGPNKCYLVTYPTGEPLIMRAYTPYVYETSDSFEEVMAFFDEQLNISRFPDNMFLENELWKRQPLTDNKELYRCFTAVNSYDVESACMLLYDRDGQTTIETIWYAGTTGAPSCKDPLYVPTTVPH